jgi:hypothetical protein
MSYPSKRSTPSLLRYVLVAAICGVLGVIAAPERRLSEEQLAGHEQARDLLDACETYRSAIYDYTRQHHVPPGLEPGRAGYRKNGAPSAECFRQQLTMWSNEWGNAAPPYVAGFDFGPYLAYGLPPNPMSGDASVRLLGDGEPFPPAADGASGWIYSPMTGEIRPNTPGTLPGSDVRFYDL